MGPLFTPPSVAATSRAARRARSIVPGRHGAPGNWHTGAFDPGDRHLLRRVAHAAGHQPRRHDRRSPNATMDSRRRRATGASAAPPAPTPWRGPDLRSRACRSSSRPYGRITAIDMNTRRARVDGRQRRRPAQPSAAEGSRSCRRSASPSRAAPLLTKTLLFIGEGSDALLGTQPRRRCAARSSAPTTRPPARSMWETELPAGTTGAPDDLHAPGQAVHRRRHRRQGQPAEWIALGLP